MNNMAATGQTINDRLNAVRYALAGQGLARTVCKATTEEVLAPKKKHIDYLLACTHEPNVSIPQLAILLIDRTQHTSWTVVFKSLISIHHLLNYGNERFTQYLATSNHCFELNDFMDRTTPQGYGMSTFVRRYAKYINDKIGAYKTLAIDLCKVKPGKDNALRTMNMDNLTKTLPVVHNQFDSLLDFGVEQKDLNNGIIMAAFKLHYKDLNRIFAAYQEAIINLVERYFKLSRKKAREALSMYKKYLDRMDKVASFFKVVEQVGLDKSEMPDTSKLTSLLGVLEEHLSQLEAKKRGTTPASPDAAGGGDEEEPVTPNKENLYPARESQQQQAPADSNKKGAPKPAASPEPPAGTSASATQEEPKRAVPPARPSPIVSPKISPKEGAPPSSSKPEKKAPPERPAKPPSRPPPPSSSATQASPTAAAAAAATTTSDQSDKQRQAATTTNESGASPTPPSRPPPAHLTEPRPQSPQSIATANSPQTSETVADQHPEPAAKIGDVLQGNGSNEQVAAEVDSQPGAGAPGDSAADEGAPTSGTCTSSTTQPTCSASASETAGQSPASTQEEQASAEVQQGACGSNHVNTNNINHHDDAIPDAEVDSPPPPLFLEDNVGDNANGPAGAEQNHQVDETHDEHLPPPPPPVEE